MPHTHPFNMTSARHASNYFVTWAATVPMVTVSLVTLAANGTVLVMFALRPSLRRSKNAYIASLALADFLIGCYMPLVALEEVGLVRVGPGPLCRTYLTLRYSLLYVSLLSVLFITLDRWWSVRWPFSYRARHTRRMAAYVISGVWALSVTLYALPMFLWEDTSRRLTLLRSHAYHDGHVINDSYDTDDNGKSRDIGGGAASDDLTGRRLGGGGGGGGEGGGVGVGGVAAAALPGECEVPYLSLIHI